MIKILYLVQIFWFPEAAASVNFIEPVNRALKRERIIYPRNSREDTAPRDKNTKRVSCTISLGNLRSGYLLRAVVKDSRNSHLLRASQNYQRRKSVRNVSSIMKWPVKLPVSIPVP